MREFQLREPSPAACVNDVSYVELMIADHIFSLCLYQIKPPVIPVQINAGCRSTMLFILNHPVDVPGKIPSFERRILKTRLTSHWVLHNCVSLTSTDQQHNH